MVNAHCLFHTIFYPTTRIVVSDEQLDHRCIQMMILVCRYEYKQKYLVREGACLKVMHVFMDDLGLNPCEDIVSRCWEKQWC